MATNKSGKHLPKHVIYIPILSAGEIGPQAPVAQVKFCCDGLKALGVDPAPFQVVINADDPSNQSGMAKLNDLCRAKQLKTVVVASLDRLGSPAAAKAFIHKVVAAGGCVIAVEECIVADRSDWALKARFASAISSSTACMVSEGVRLGQENCLRTGGASLGVATYGYTSVKIDPKAMRCWKANRGGRKVIVVDAAQAEVARRIFAFAHRGDSPSEIAAWLNDNVIPVWETTRTNIKDLTGQKIRVPAMPFGYQARRPKLRIVSNEVFYGVQAMLKGKDLGPNAPENDAA